MNEALVIIGWIVVFMVSAYATFVFFGAMFMTKAFGGSGLGWGNLLLIPVGLLWWLCFYLWPFSVAIKVAGN